MYKINSYFVSDIIDISKELKKFSFKVKNYKTFNNFYKYAHNNIDLFIIDITVDYLINSNKIKNIIDMFNVPILFLTDPLYQCICIKRILWNNPMCFMTFKPLFITKDFKHDIDIAISSKRIRRRMPC